MKLSQLYYFQKTAQLGGVSAAAQELHISQPAITTAIHTLEEELNVTLFRRVKQRMVLTEQGEFFLSRVEVILADLDQAVLETRELDGQNARLRLGIPPLIGLLYTRPLLEEIHKIHPGIELQLVEANTRELRRLLNEGRIDMALMIGESPYSRGLERQLLLETSYSFFLGREHPLAGSPFLSARAVSALPLILFDQGLFLNQYITDAFQAQGLFANVIFAGSQISAIKAYVSAGYGGTFLIRECVGPRDALVEVPTEITPPVSIVAAWPRMQPLSPAMGRVLRYLKRLR